MTHLAVSAWRCSRCCFLEPHPPADVQGSPGGPWHRSRDRGAGAVAAVLLLTPGLGARGCVLPPHPSPPPLLSPSGWCWSPVACSSAHRVPGTSVFTAVAASGKGPGFPPCAEHLLWLRAPAPPPPSPRASGIVPSCSRRCTAGTVRRRQSLRGHLMGQGRSLHGPRRHERQRHYAGCSGGPGRRPQCPTWGRTVRALPWEIARCQHYLLGITCLLTFLLP